MVKPHPLFLDRLSGTKVRNNMREGKKWENLVTKPVFNLLEEINGEERIKSLTQN
jgi:nicotinamide-nucleotide adenylyltransferase